jgi:hypothetical protein
MALFCSQAIPLYGLLRVLRDTLTSGVANTQIKLGTRISLFCSQAIPLYGLLRVLRDAFAKEIFKAEGILGFSVPLFSFY